MLTIRSPFRASWLLTLLAFIGIAACAPASAQTRYTFTDLSALLGTPYSQSQATAINDNGQVVGWSFDFLGLHNFTWTESGGVQELDTPPGFIPSPVSGSGINNAGQVVGVLDSSLSSRAFIWTQSTGMQYLGPPTGVGLIRTTDINNSGRVVGREGVAGGFSRAYVWTQSGGMQYLNPLPNGLSSSAMSINDSGYVVGDSLFSPSVNRACIWMQSGGVQDLGTLPNHMSSSAQSINSSNQIVGWSSSRTDPFPNQYRAFLRTQNGEMHDLGTLPGQTASLARSINDNGLVVGDSYTGADSGSASRAFVWTPSDGMKDLNDLIPAGSDWVLSSALAINNRGQIVGSGFHSGRRRAFLLTPVPLSITSFTLSPNLVNAPGESVSAEVFTSEPVAEVTITCDPANVDGPAPLFRLARQGNRWTASIPTQFLLRARINPLPLIAVARRQDGATAQAVATLGIRQDLPALALSLTSNKNAVARNEAATLDCTIRNPSRSLADFVRLEIAVPNGLEVRSYPGLTYNAATRRLTWAGSLAAQGSFQSFRSFRFSVQVNRNTPRNTLLQFDATVTCAGFQSASQPTTLRVISGLVPVGVDVDATDGFGLLFGDVDILGEFGTPPLHAILEPRPEAVGLFGGTRRLSIWLGVDTYTTGQATASPGPGASGVLARIGLIAPSVSPSYNAIFPAVNDSVVMTVSFTERAAMMTFFETIVTAAGFRVGPDKLAEVADDVRGISGIYNAAQKFKPLPKNSYELSRAVASASSDLIHMDGADLQALENILQRLTGVDLDRARLVRILEAVGQVKALLETISDLTVLNIQTIGEPMVVRFIASPLRRLP